MILKNIKLENLPVKENTRYFEDDFYEDSDDDFDKYSDDSDDEDGEEEDHLCYLIRSMFNNYGVSAYVERDDLDIILYIYLQKKEKMQNILRCFDIVTNKLKRDILPQYESELELYESKEGIPILQFSFFYADGDKDDRAPF